MVGGEVAVPWWRDSGGAVHRGPGTTVLRALAPLALSEQQTGHPGTLMAPWGGGAGGTRLHVLDPRRR